jgi:hypothetical protein
MIVNNVSALDRLFWKRAQASILQSPKIRAGVTRSPELRLAGRRTRIGGSSGRAM